MSDHKRYPCPCCGYLVFDEPAGSFEICRICFWEDDDVQLAFPHMGGGANALSLIEAQKNYGRMKVSDGRFFGEGFGAAEGEEREEGWRMFDVSKDLSLNWMSEEDRRLWKLERDGSVFYWWREGFWLKRGR